MATLQDIRQRYPQYQDLSDQDLADKFHDKFYSDMPKDQYYSKIGFAPGQSSTGAPSSSPIMSFMKNAVRGTLDATLGVGKQMNAAGNLMNQATEEQNRVGVGQTLANVGIGAGKGIYNTPEKMIESAGKTLVGHPWNLYNTLQPQGPTQQIAANIAPYATGGGEARLAEKFIGKGLAKIGLEKGIIPTAAKLFGGGAAASMPFGVNAFEGGIANTILGGLIPGVFKGVGAGIRHVGEPTYLYHKLVNHMENASSAPGRIWNDMKGAYEDVGNKAQAAYTNLDQKVANTPHTYEGTPFFDDVKKSVAELDQKIKDNPGDDNLIKQRTWVSQFLPKPSYTDVTGKVVPMEAPGMQLNNFSDAFNMDKQLNSLYKTTAVEQNKGIIPYYAKLKKSLEDNMESNGKNLPDDFKQDYRDAKDLWIQKKGFERTDPEGRQVSPFFRQYRLNPNSPGDFLAKYLKKSSGLAEHSAVLQHLSDRISPQSKDELAAAALAPDVSSPKTYLSQVGAKLSKMSDEQKTILFGDKKALADKLQQEAHDPKYAGLAKYASKLVGLMEGLALHHPFMGYTAGAMAPKVMEQARDIKLVRPKEGKSILQHVIGKSQDASQVLGGQGPEDETSYFRQFGTLPAAINNGANNK